MEPPRNGAPLSPISLSCRKAILYCISAGSRISRSRLFEVQLVPRQGDYCLQSQRIRPRRTITRHRYPALIRKADISDTIMQGRPFRGGVSRVRTDSRQRHGPGRTMVTAAQDQQRCACSGCRVSFSGLMLTMKQQTKILGGSRACTMSRSMCVCMWDKYEKMGDESELRALGSRCYGSGAETGSPLRWLQSTFHFPRQPAQQRAKIPSAQISADRL